MKIVFITILFLSSFLFAQQRPVKVYSERDKASGSVVIYADNNSYMSYTVMLNFSQLENAQHGIANPYLTTISPGKNTILTIKKSTSANNSIRYRYKYNYRKGCMKPVINKDIAYLIPVSPGKETRIKYLNNFSASKFGKELPKDWVVYGFKLMKGDTVYASRKGVVSKIKKSNQVVAEYAVYDSNRNYMQVFHKDCSFMRYTSLDKFFVKEGDAVLPGQPIGIMGANENKEKTTLMMSAFYYDIKVLINGNMESNSIYLPLKFDVNGSPQRLFEENTYYSVHRLETITQEMRKKEIKKYKKQYGIQ